jgi:inner membrane protein
MKWINHIAIAGAVTAVYNPVLVPVAILGSTAPDWLEWLLAAVGKKVKHRTVTHYVVLWIFGVLFGVFIFDFHHIITAFSLGGLSHVLADAFTVQGVPLAWWSVSRFTLFGGRFRTGQPGEYFVSGAVIIICFALAMVTRNFDNSFSPFFFDWAECYKKGLCSAYEYKANRLRFF